MYNFYKLSTAFFKCHKVNIYKYEIEKLCKSWENPYKIYSERYNKNDGFIFEKFLNNIGKNLTERKHYTDVFSKIQVEDKIAEGNYLYSFTTNSKKTSSRWSPSLRMGYSVICIQQFS